MPRFTQHIAGFFLLLSLTFIFPLQHFHECEEEIKECVHAQTDVECLSSFHGDCELCDIVFPLVIIPENAISLEEPSLLGQNTLSLEESPHKVSLSYFYLRAPPLG